MVTPIEDHTKLSVDPKGLDVLRRITGLVVPVVIIGPYRSGKSYTLNQLISVGCGTSHALWQQPHYQLAVPLATPSVNAHVQMKDLRWVTSDRRRRKACGCGASRRSSKWTISPCRCDRVWPHDHMLCNTMRVLFYHTARTQVIYMDTEGFEASGKSDAYDDRVFALSTFISALLIYNLPETVRESDIEKLSFAVELAQAFFADMKARNSFREYHYLQRVCLITSGCHHTYKGTVYAPARSQGDGGSSVEPGNMLWLIQRDFLEGKSVEAMVKESLAPVANPHGDRDITQVPCSSRM